MEIKTPKDIMDYCKSIVEDTINDIESVDGKVDETELMERIEQDIDGDEYVIYYAKAWDLVNAARGYSEMFDAGEEYAREIGAFGEVESLDGLMTKVSYSILHEECMRVLQEDYADSFVEEEEE